MANPSTLGGGQFLVVVGVDSKGVHIPYCKHGCGRDGGYGCSIAKAVEASKLKSHLDLTYAPSDVIIKDINLLYDAVKGSREDFLNKYLDDHISDFNIPEEYADEFRQILKDGLDNAGFDINLFGGDPEWYPEVIEVIRELKEDKSRKYIVNLTTTGSRIITDDEFFQELYSAPLDLLALSIDDTDCLQYFSSSPEEVKRVYNEYKERCSLEKIKPQGQWMKSMEGLYAAKILKNKNPDMKVLFNVVIKKQNLDNVYDIVTGLNEEFPMAKINPYFAQSFGDEEEPAFREEHLDKLEGFVDYMLELNKKIDTDKPFSPKIHYWIMLKSAFETWRDDKERLLRGLSGDGIWNCSRTKGRELYALATASKNKNVGGPRIIQGCQWDDMVNVEEKGLYDMTVEDVKNHMQNIGETARNANYSCRGDIMPRITAGNIFSLEAGLSDELKPKYIEIRNDILKSLLNERKENASS